MGEQVFQQAIGHKQGRTMIPENYSMTAMQLQRNQRPESEVLAEVAEHLRDLNAAFAPGILATRPTREDWPEGRTTGVLPGHSEMLTWDKPVQERLTGQLEALAPSLVPQFLAAVRQWISQFPEG